MKLMFNTIRHPYPDVHPGRSITFVEIYDGDNELLAKGEAIKRPDEPFNKVIGFQYAVKNAIKGLDKVLRTLIWGKFFNHSKKTRQLLNQRRNNE